jgi:hypothetical protein
MAPLAKLPNSEPLNLLPPSFGMILARTPPVATSTEMPLDSNTMSSI